MVDPGTARRPASIRAWELLDGQYVEQPGASGDEARQVERPFPVTLVPDRLLDD